MTLIETVRKTIKEHELVKQGDKVIAAFSGGADSVCMLHVLYGLSVSMGFSLYAAHVHHGLRGKSADGDARFAEEFCQSYQIPFFIQHADVAAYASTNALSIEDAGRRVRYDFFYELLRKLSADVIATAHHKNDNAETVLHHLLRGSGINGLQGILPKNGRIIRPLIAVAGCETKDYCITNGLSYRTDESNSDKSFTRNRIRLELIPYLENNFNSNIVSALCGLSEIAAADKRYFDQMTEKLSKKLLTFDLQSCTIDKREFLKLPDALQSRMIRYAGEQLDISFEFKHILLLKQMLEKDRTGKRLCLPNGYIELSYDQILLKKECAVISFCYQLQEEMELLIPEAGLFLTTAKDGEGVVLPRGKKIEIRSRKDGDKIRVRDMTKKIKDIFIDNKVPREKRDQIPVVTVDDVPVWVVGFAKGDLLLQYKKNASTFVLNLSNKEYNNE